MKAASADRARAFEITPVSRETAERLDAFVTLLLRWQARINLISASTIDQLWVRHIADSLQLLPLGVEAGVWIDIGSGAGFPGMIVAIAAAGRSELRVILAESNHKRCAFLHEALRVTGARAEIVADRIESRPDLPPADVVSARAVADLPSLLEMAYPLLKTGGIGLFPKGQDVEMELTQASKCWRFNHRLTPSRTDPKARIVTVSNLQRLQLPHS